MKGLLIFPTLVVILIITIYFESSSFVFVLIVLILRILLLKNKFLNCLVICLSGIFLLRCQLLEYNHQIIKPEIKTILISPDKLTVNGDILTGEAITKKQTVRFIYRIKDRSEQKYWQDLSQIVQADVVVKKVDLVKGPRNPAEFNYQKYLYHNNINFSVQIERLERVRVYSPITIFEKINALRIHIIKYLANLPKWLRIHAQSLIVGYTGHDDKSFLKILSVLGVIHLFSLSGLHVFILLTIIRKLTSAIKIPLEWVNTSMLLILPCYGMLVGSKSGIWRAIVLAMVGIICQKFNLTLSRLDIFSLTMLICLFIYPFAITEMGGQLSFLLAFGILYLYKNTKFILATIKMNLVSLPVICFYTYQFNCLTLLVNLIFIPVFTYIILPITLISSLTVHWKFWEIINSYFDKLYKVLDLLANDRNFTFITGKIPAILVILIILVTFFYLESSKFWNKYLKIYLFLFVLCILVNKFPLFGAVHLIDVGQGDSIMITTPLNHQTFLIDVGGKLNFPTKKWAKRTNSNQVEVTTIPFLKAQGISKVDKLFLTHKDVDHVGNLLTFLDKFTVKEMNFGIGLESNPRIKAAIKNHPEVKFKNLCQNDTFKTNFISWQVLWPKTKGIGENGDSLTMLAKIHNKSWLFTGDLDIAGEQGILKDHKFKVDYLKVGHHGSKTATSDQLLKQVTPKIGFISAGVNNRYGHPNKETIQRLEDNHVQYFNTAEYGMISWYYNFWNDDEKLTTFLKGDLVENNRIKKEFETR